MGWRRAFSLGSPSPGGLSNLTLRSGIDLGVGVELESVCEPIVFAGSFGRAEVVGLGVERGDTTFLFRKPFENPKVVGLPAVKVEEAAEAGAAGSAGAE